MFANHSKQPWLLFQAGGPGQTDRSSPLLADWSTDRQAGSPCVVPGTVRCCR